MKILENWIKIKEAEKLTRISRTTLSYHAREGNIEAMQDPDDRRRKLYKKSDLIDLYDLNMEKPKPKVKEKKEKNTIIVNDQHCKNCPWKEGPVCPFVRCVRHNGWSAEVKDIANIR